MAKPEVRAVFRRKEIILKTSLICLTVDILSKRQHLIDISQNLLRNEMLNTLDTSWIFQTYAMVLGGKRLIVISVIFDIMIPGNMDMNRR